MAYFGLPARRILVAGGFALAIAVIPGVAAFAGTATNAVAQPTQCGDGEEMDTYNLECIPILAPGGFTAPGGLVATPNDIAPGGAPSEQDLTDTNPGVLSPARR